MKLLSICSFILIAFCGYSQPKTIDKIVAQVGDKVILLSDIQGQKLQALQAGVTLEPALDCQILEELMFQNLLLNQAILDSVIVTDAQVDGEMENRIRMIENQIGSRQKMEEFYGKSITQIKKEFRSAIKDQLLSQEMARQITQEVSITPREVQKFYNSLPADSIPFINSQLSFQQIVHYPQITPEDKKIAYDHLTEIYNDIIGGKSFSTQARIHSMDPGSASKGGEISASRGMMVAPFEAALFNLKEGEVSSIFETTYGYHIVKLIERRGDDYKCQHILIIPEFKNDALEASALKVDSAYQQILNGTLTWEEAVIKYSNDETTMQNKGIITNPITGEQTWDMEDLNQVDQQIYLITDAMEINDVSEPNLYTDLFERKQGVRIVRLMARTEPHRANLKDDYSLIKSAAENDKKEMIINEWINLKIKNAYIRIDDSYKNCNFKNAWLN
jgi:peptidyl-prolyl cis-trans isomerase SurA